MLLNFFSLNGTPREFRDNIGLEEFKNHYNRNDTIRNCIFFPDELKNEKIKHKTFNNVSLSKTILENIEFTNCHFIDCLFIGSTIKKCKFIECSFTGCNTHALNIEATYINPVFFKENFKNLNYSYSNIAIHLYQELYNNSNDLQLVDFSKKAKYNLLKWEGRLLISKYKYKQPYKIAFCEFVIHYIPNIFFRKVFGYGLRLRNFICTFFITFAICFLINKLYWIDYKLENKDITIESFSSNTYNHQANFFYTTDILTKVIDSQFQPTSNLGMTLLTIQGFLGFILFSFLVTIIINKFIK